MMDSTFVWILVFAGAAVALLGLFLVASERELKNKRREIEGLVARLATQPQTAPAQSMEASAAEHAELLARNRELENQLQILADELTQSRRSGETLQTTQWDVEAQDQVRRLSIAYEELDREAQELRSRLAAGEADRRNAPGDDAPAASRRQAEIDEMRRALDHSRARITELEEASNDLPDRNLIAREREAERQNFQAQIADLEKRLMEQRQDLAEAQSLRERILESERNQQELRAQISRYENDVPTWQARIAAAEAGASRLAAVQRPYQELLKRHASIAELQRGLQEEFAALAQQISAPIDGAGPATSVGFSAGSYPEATDSSANPASAGSSSPNASTAKTAGPAETSAKKPASGAATDPRTHRFGLFMALLFTMATGIVAVQFLGSEWEQPAVEAVTARALDQMAPIASAAPARQQRETPSEKISPPAVSKTAPLKAANRRNEMHTEQLDTPAPAQTGRSGMYKVARPSRVYAAPSELSRSLGDIEPGINVNVVNARDGWLEIHSKHGRPPGFIREEAVVRVLGAN